MLLPLSLVFLLAERVSSSQSSSTYSESLTLSGLSDGKVLSAFDFSLSSSQLSDSQTTHSSLLPPLLLSLLNLYSLDSFSLTLSSGRWSSHWPPNPAFTSAPSGIELAAWLQLFDGDDERAERDRWSRFKGAVSGAFCAGIAEGGTAEGDSPTSVGVAKREHPFRGSADPLEHSLYSIHLPRLSATCTESLTPFLALLPCGAHAGIASLLNPHKLFDGDWTMIRIEAQRQPGGGATVRLQVGSVGDPVRRDRLEGGMGRRDFSMQSLYDRTLHRACPVASESRVSVTIPVNSLSHFEISPGEGPGRAILDGKVTWDTTEAGFDSGTPLDVKLHWTENQFRYPQPLPTLSPLTTRRLLTGHGQERGEIGVELTNHLDHAVEVVWIERWPWCLRGFVSGVKSSVLSSSNHSTSPAPNSLITHLSYSPPIARRRPTTLSITLSLPAYSTSRLLVPYESSYLWYTEYPSDAHRGFEIPGATFLLHGQRFHTPSTLLSLPTPDFSMPYNVIILTSTLMALFFGSVMNALVRGWVVVDLEGEKEREREKEKEKGGVELGTVEARMVEARWVEGRTVESRSVESRSVEGRTVEARTVEARTVEARTVQRRTVEARWVESRTVESKEG